MAITNTGERYKVQDASNASLKPYNLQLTTGSRGFALLIAVIFMSVMLSLGLALGSLGYKQETLASSAIESQYAFYTADTALECALYADQQQNLFTYTSHSSNNPPNLIACGTASATQLNYLYTATQLSVTERLSFDSNTHCADVTIYKYSTPQNGISTYLFSQGYDVSCTIVANPNGARFVSRGESSHY